jgi:hypothetical protein
MVVLRFWDWFLCRFRRKKKKAPAPITTITAIAAIPPTAADEIPPELLVSAAGVAVDEATLDVGAMVGGGITEDAMVAGWVILPPAEFESTADDFLAAADDDAVDA